MNLHVFGCSLSHHLSWKDSTAKKLNLNLCDYSNGAGSNTLMIQRFHHCVLGNTIMSNDIIIWQVTFPRITIRWINDPYHREKAEELQQKSRYPNFVIKSKNFFDNQYRIDLLNNNPYITNDMHMYYDHNQDLEDITATLILAKKMFPKLLVLLGWQNVIHNDNLDKFWKKLEEHNIDHVKVPILEWVKQNNLELLDDGHPTNQSSCQYGEQVVVPKLQQLNWL